MVWSLGAVFAVVALLMVINYRPHSQVTQSVDYPAAVELATSQANWPILVPAAVPAGYTVTSARFEAETYGGNGDTRWYLGLSDGKSGYVSIWQSDGRSGKVIAAATNNADCTDTAVVAAVTWQKCEVAKPLTRSLVHVVDKQTVVVSGTASWDVINAFAASLVEKAPTH